MNRILLVFLLTAVSCLEAQTGVNLPFNSCLLTGRFRDINRTTFSIKIEDAIYSAPTVESVKTWWGTAQGTPGRVTCLVDFRVGSVPVKIPYKAYADLGNPLIPGGITVTRTEGEIRLNISGGEGGAAYTATYVVVNGVLARREIVPTGNPGAQPVVSVFN